MKQILIKIKNFADQSFTGNRFYLTIFFLFVFRLWIGLSQRFWSLDEIQVFLIGLKHFTTGEWPYWGADIVYTESRIPGALQGLLISVPLMILHIPEAPIIALNLLSFGALCYFAWFLLKSGIELPRWFVWVFLLVIPWTTEYSTHIVNPSYVLFGSILFFTGFVDVTGLMERPVLSRKLGFLFMGFSLAWIFQLHLSWVLLLPFILFAFIKAIPNKKNIWFYILFFTIGFLLSSITWIPTMLTYPEILTGGMGKNVAFNKESIIEFFAMFGRFVAFSGFDISRFMSSISDLTHHLKYHPAIYPVAIVLVLSMLAQIIFTIRSLFLKSNSRVYKNIRKLFLIAFLLAWFSFLFSIKKPIGYTFYVLFPVSVLYTFIIISPLFKKQMFRYLVTVLLVFSMIYSISNSIFVLNRESLYTNRFDVVKAINTREYTCTYGFRRTAFFEKQTETLWSKSLIKSRDDNDQVEMLCDFEYTDNLTRPQFISRQKPYAGEYSCVMHKNSRFSSDLTIPLTDITSDTIETIFHLHSLLKDTLLWVITFEGIGDKDNWFSVPIVIQNTNQWRLYRYKFKIPQHIPEEALLKTYIWRPGSEKRNLIYLDDFIIRWDLKAD